MTNEETATILVVDDTEAQRYAMSRALRNDGFVVREAATGIEALQAAQELPDVILLDVKLPDIGGFEVCQRLKADPRTAHIPVVQVSAHFVDSSYRTEGLRRGADDYIAQPVPLPELVAKVRVWVRVARTEAQLRRTNQELKKDILERERAEKEIAHLATFPELNPNPIVETDLEGNITYANPAARRQFPQLEETGAEQLMQGWSAILATLKADPQQTIVREIEAEGRTSLQTIHCDPQLGFVRAYFLDITLRRKAEQAVRQAEEQFRSLANAIPQLCWMANADGWITWYNQRWYEYTGTTPEQMEGWGWQSVHDPEALPGVLERWKDSIRTGSPFDMVFPLRGADGVFRQFLTRILPIKDAGGRVVRWFGTNTDVNELHNAEEAAQRALAEAEERRRILDAMMASIPLGIAIADAPDVKIRAVSRFGQALVDQTDQGLTGIAAQEHPAIWELYHNDGVTPATREELPLTRATLQGEFVAGEEWMTRRQDGTKVPILCTAAPIRDEQGQITGGVVAWQDMTERKRTEEVLLRSEKLASVGRMAASIAHEINNPLETITNILYLLGFDKGLSEKSRLQLAIADEEMERVSHLTKQTLAFYRDDGKVGEVHLSTVVDKVAAVYKPRAARSGIRLDTEGEPGCVVRGSAGELTQVVSNLVVNAMDAVPTGGRVLVRTTRAQALGDRVRITVADNGAGIAPAQLPRIFEPFFTTKRDVGTGLGLWITRELVAKHRGSIRVKSRHGVGTVVSVLLPGGCEFRNAAVESISVPV